MRFQYNIKPEHLQQFEAKRPDSQALDKYHVGYPQPMESMQYGYVGVYL